MNKSVSFAEQKKCSPGNYLCGQRCISGKKNCRKTPNPDAQKAASELSDLIQRVARGKGTESDLKQVATGSKELDKAIKKEKKKLQKTTEKVKSEKDVEKAIEQVSEAEKEVRQLVEDFDNEISKLSGDSGQEMTQEENLRASLDILDMLDDYDNMITSLEEKPGALAITGNTRSLTRQRREEENRQRQVNDDGVIDVEAVSLGTDKTRAQKIGGAAGRTAARIENALLPDRRPGQSKVSAIAGSLGRNAARVQAGKNRAVADTKSVLDAFERFRRNRRNR